MYSYQSQSIRPIRNPLNSGIPPERRQHWTELPGWVTAYIRGKTEIGKKDTQNAQIYDILCKLWKVSNSFGIRSGVEDAQVFIISEAPITRDPNRSSHHSINSQGQSLAKDMVEILEYLVTNNSWTSNPKRLGWLNSNLDQELLNYSKLNDWIVFPAPDFIHWISDQVPKTSQKLLRHIPRSIPCKVAVFGNLNQSTLGQFSAASMQFSQVWHRGIFLTITSQAAASDPASLKKLISKLIKRQYDHLEHLNKPEGKFELTLWLSLHTYWLLSPSSMNQNQSNQINIIKKIRAFNELHNPDLIQTVPIINLSQMKNGIKELLNEGNQSIHLMKIKDIIQHIKIPRSQLNHSIQIMLDDFDEKSYYQKKKNDDEIHSIIDTAIQLLNTFWSFRINLIIVDPTTLKNLDQSQFPSCQFITFETLFLLMRNDFSE